jgi:prolyl oligopeptidase
MLAADSDDRVDPMHARKFTAAVQHASDRPAWLRVEATPATAAPT